MFLKGNNRLGVSNWSSAKTDLNAKMCTMQLYQIQHRKKQFYTFKIARNRSLLCVDVSSMKPNQLSTFQLSSETVCRCFNLDPVDVLVCRRFLLSTF